MVWMKAVDDTAFVVVVAAKDLIAGRLVRHRQNVRFRSGCKALVDFRCQA